MVRNRNVFTSRQIKLLQATLEKLKEITDPDPEIITHETFKWHIKQTKQFGKLPALSFKPNCNQIKAEITRSANLTNKTRNTSLQKIRDQFGISDIKNREARLFNSELDNILFAWKKHIYAAALINNFFTAANQTVSEPFVLMQEILKEEYIMLFQPPGPIHDHGTTQPKTQESRKMRTYEQELLDEDYNEGRS